MSFGEASLTRFHPVVQRWFKDQFGQPTDIQAKSWPRISADEHLVITAPTGSGKTLTAFLWSINQFINGSYETGTTRVLYVSPLKALNNDIQKNLVLPLAQLKQSFVEQGLEFPSIRVQTRSGDTDQQDRRRMLKHPPEILITTPESLNLLLSSKGGQSILHGLETVIIDEIHGVVNSKRGVYLMSAIERLVSLSGEFQRIALSATVQPLDAVAKFVAGYELGGSLQAPEYLPRKISTIKSNSEKRYEYTIRYPAATAARADNEKPWDTLAKDLVQKIENNKSTLIFVNSRVLCEKMTFKINTAAKRTLAYAHHGSLSREIRTEVESRLKEGELAAIVATGTLEMGIDIGHLDEVVLLQSPDGISSAIQRIGRAGHGVGETSRCTIYPTHPMDFIEAAALSKAINERDIEPVKLINNPLDVLAQIIISITGTCEWDVDELFQEVKRSTPFNSLSRTQFDLVITMLAGRYEIHHIRELRPRVRIDKINNKIEANRGALMSLYLSGGVIPDRGYFQIRHSETNARIGELDEEFVWEANPGQAFSFGTQQWQVQRITHNDVMVTPAKPGAIAPPFWISESINRDFHYAERVGNFLEYANERLSSAAPKKIGKLSANNHVKQNDEEREFETQLREEFFLDETATEELMTFLKRQRSHTNAQLPHRHHLLVEKIAGTPGRMPGNQLVIHTGWGARVNRPLALALEAGWYRKFSEQPEVFVSNESLVIQLPHETSFNELITLVPADQLESLLRERLEGSGFFGSRFRENAGRALLLSKGRFNERKPLWMSRLQSQKLLDVTSKFDDFPIMLETWRTCMQDEFDIPNLKKLLTEVNNGAITVTEVSTRSPSPFAQTVAWGQINLYMYRDDQPKNARGTNAGSNLRNELLQEVVFNEGLRVSIPRQLIKAFEQKRQRLLPGYLPENNQDLIEWTKERTAIPISEWAALLEPDEISSSKLDTLLTEVKHNSAAFIVAQEDKSWILAALGQNTNIDSSTADDASTDEHTIPLSEQADLTGMLANWLQFYGPLTLAEIESKLGLKPEILLSALLALESERVVIQGQLVSEPENLDAHYWCDAANFEILLRQLRHQRREIAEAEFEPLPLEGLTPFLYLWQTKDTDSVRQDTSDAGIEKLFNLIEKLRCYPAAVGAWETDFFPSRINNYQNHLLDSLIREGHLTWIGCGEKQVQWVFEEDRDLISPQLEASTNDDAISTDQGSHTPQSFENLLPGDTGRYDFNDISDHTGLSTSETAAILWKFAWLGRVSTDSFAVLRQGVETKFSLPEIQSVSSRQRRGIRRGGFSQWKSSIPSAGSWYKVAYPENSSSLIENEELNKERVRVLLDRYGILFRELLTRELPELNWRSLFRSIRLMELAGELTQGYFFKEIPGPQFVSPAALRELHHWSPMAQASNQPAHKQNTTFWINATDPISLAGIGIDALKGVYPRRIPSNHIVFEGTAIVLISEKNGRNITINVPSSAPSLPAYFEVFRNMLYRTFDPKVKIVIETINQLPARQSEYLDTFEQCFDVVKDHRAIYLQRTLT